MTRLLLISMRSSIVIVLCILLFTGCSSLLIHDDDNIAVVATKVIVRAANCALTIFGGCVSEWGWMHDAYVESLVWYGKGDINGDNYKCKQEASSSSSGATGFIHMPLGKNVISLPMDSGGGGQINQQLYHSCMSARGYTLVDGYELKRWREKQANASVSTLQSEQDANTQNSRGVMYQTGQGVPQDYAQARQWYEKAAAQGEAHAQSNLGLLYANGLGVPRDYAQARQWYEKAVAQGHEQAQADLGWLYASGGYGVPQDYAQARQWYEKAAAQGNADGQFYLGWMYAYGQGVSQDLVQAYRWLDVAAAQGKKVAGQERDKVVMKLTPSQLAESQRLAQQCQSQQFKGC